MEGNVKLQEQTPYEWKKPRENGVKWIQKNLFNNITNSLLTISFSLLIFFIVKGSLTWVLTVADWNVVVENYKLILAGQFPVNEMWRLWVSTLIFSLLVGASWGIWRQSFQSTAFFFFAIYGIHLLFPFVGGQSKGWLIGNILLIIVGFLLGNRFSKITNIIIFGWLLLGPFVMMLLNGFGVVGAVNSNVWGGFLLTALISIISIVFSFPLGILLALGRRSKLPLIKAICIIYIEVIRGIPLITVLFVAQLMLPLFLGGGIEISNVMRAMVGFTLFSAAYLAENVRGGLQSIPRGQIEAAQALGLSQIKLTIFIVLPQAFRAIIPALVGQFIAIIKDTSLVAIVGLIDLLGMAKKISSNPAFLGKQLELFLFVGFVYFLFCYLLGYMSRRLEKTLGVGER